MSKTISLDIPETAEERVNKMRYRELAMNIARDSIVTSALARLIEQMVDEVTRYHKRRIEELEAALEKSAHWEQWWLDENTRAKELLALLARVRAHGGIEPQLDAEIDAALNGPCDCLQPCSDDKCSGWAANYDVDGDAP